MRILMKLISIYKLLRMLLLVDLYNFLVVKEQKYIVEYKSSDYAYFNELNVNCRNQVLCSFRTLLNFIESYLY